MTTTKVTTYQNYIGGRWVASESGKTYPITNPASKDTVLGEFQTSGEADALQAVAAAQQALPGWAETPAPARASVLFRALEILRQRADDIARTITTEEGKGLADAQGEVKRAMNIMEYAAGEGRRMFGYTTPSELPNTVAYTTRRPLGVVAIITPWNFPIAIPTWKIAPALICGNTLVFKPASGTPLSAVKLMEVFEEAGLPPGVLNLVTGPGSRVGNALVESPEVKAISFTGSTEIGTDIYSLGARSLKKVQCEMGGKNAVILLADADLDKALGGIVQGAFGSTGQRCTATSRVIVEASIYDEFMEQLIERTGKLKIGNGLDVDVDISPLSSKSQFDTVSEYIGIGTEEGANLVFGGRSLSGGIYDERILHRADHFHRRRSGHAHRPGGDFRPGADRVQSRGPGGSYSDFQQRKIWPFLLGVHQGPDPGLPVHQHRGRRHGPRERPDIGRRSAPALWRTQIVGSRPAGTGSGGV